MLYKCYTNVLCLLGSLAKISIWVYMTVADLGSEKVAGGGGGGGGDTPEDFLADLGQLSGLIKEFVHK